ncbi:hypothetical protein AAE478_006881 [Parahypoxylon ruwenzoriense]
MEATANNRAFCTLPRWTPGSRGSFQINFSIVLRNLPTLDANQLSSFQSRMGEAAESLLNGVRLEYIEAKKFLDKERQRLPRFLFRGFHPDSGGGFDGLNGPAGIVPHDFLDGKDVVPFFSTPNLKYRVDCHMNQKEVGTCFSSWSPDLETALAYTQYLDDGSYLAILDTSLLGRHVEIHHTVSLSDIGLADSYDPDEFLLYGPIGGQAYHCVPCSEIQKLGFSDDYLSWDSKPVTREEVRAAIRIAELFRQDGDQRPDVILAVTAAFMTCHLRTWDRRSKKGERDKNFEMIGEELSKMCGIFDRTRDGRLVRPPSGRSYNPRTLCGYKSNMFRMMTLLYYLEGKLANYW